MFECQGHFCPAVLGHERVDSIPFFVAGKSVGDARRVTLHSERDVTSPSTHGVTLPFSDPPDLGVFVSRQVMDGRDIRVVDHYEDGDWVFLAGEERRDQSNEIADEELLLMCLQHVVESHPEVHACADLPQGYSAAYDDNEGRWVRVALTQPGGASD